jgi:DNA-binding IclR family transcriptional regulator
VNRGKRLLSTLRLFVLGRPVLTVEEIAVTSGISLSTAYRDVRQLTDHGFLEPAGGLGYALGPAIVELDHVIRLNDILIHLGRETLGQLQIDSGRAVTVLLCRYYRHQIVCVEQRMAVDGGEATAGCERGHPMSALNSAFAVAILAHLSRPVAGRVLLAESGLGPGDWKRLRNEFSRIRKVGVAVCTGAPPLGITTIAACVFGGGARPIGSIGAVLLDERATPPVTARVSALVQISARELSAAITSHQ